MKYRPKIAHNIYIYIYAAIIAFSSKALALTVTPTEAHHKGSYIIDGQEATFSWQIADESRDVKQTNYEITLYSDPAMAIPVWSSGVVESDASQCVRAEGLTLLPHRRYYWGVTITDNHGREATSTQEAHFDTGVMGDWSGARWLKATDKAAGDNNPIKTIVEADITISSGNPAVIFGWNADRSYFMWQIVTDEGSHPILRRNVRTFSDELWHSDLTLKNLSNTDITGGNKSIDLRIEALGASIVTYINGTMVDDYKCPVRGVPNGKIGLRVAGSDIAYYDNLRVRQVYPDGKEIVALQEDFEANVSTYFIGAEIVDVKGGHVCRLAADGSERKLLQVDCEAPAFYKSFTIDGGKRIRSAMLYTSSLGVHDVWVNGQRVGHRRADGTMQYEEMKTGWTDYRKRVGYCAHDVTDLCRGGINTIGAVVGSGWVSGGISRYIYKYPLGIAFMGKLVVRYTDGTEQTIVTDDTWLAAKCGPLLLSDIYNGEYYDARRSYPWVSEPEIRPLAVELYDYPGEVAPQIGPSITSLDEHTLSPKTITVYNGSIPGKDFGMINVVSVSDAKPTTLRRGETAIYDFGQNCAGVPDLSVKGKQGTRLHLRFAETVNDSGELSRGNDGPGGSIYRAHLGGANAEVYYILSGDTQGENYRTSTSYFGARYCEVTASDDVEVRSLKFVPWSSAHQETGSIETDNEMVNRLISNITWSQRSNMMSIPTDCPQRAERLGWTGDAQVFSNTAMYTSRSANFYRKWLQDMRDAQRPDGCYPDIAPESLTKYGTAAWADAGVIVPWNAYVMTGDTEIISENYASMERYMDWLAEQTDGSIKHPGAGTSTGDWTAPVSTDKRYISMVYYAHTASLMAEMSDILSKAQTDSYALAANRYRQLADEIKAEIQERYFTAYSPKASTQTACAMALHFNICKDEEQRTKTARKLENRIEANGNRLNTGFLGTAIINTALSEAGLDDCAYNLLLQRSYPSWLYSIDQGATTTWEHWNSYTYDDGFRDPSMNSLNHYAYGAVKEWMYRHMAGIAPIASAPGFRKIIFSPSPDMRPNVPHESRISHVKASINPGCGTISAEWITGSEGEMTYRIVVPPNTEAEVRLPVPSPDARVTESGVAADDAPGVDYLGYADGRKVYAVTSGTYKFSTGDASGIDDIAKDSASGVRVYPNPTIGILNICAEAPITQSTLTSLSGQVLRIGIAGSSTLDLTGIAPGIYLLTVETAGCKRTMRVIKR